MDSLVMRFKTLRITECTMLSHRSTRWKERSGGVTGCFRVVTLRIPADCTHSPARPPPSRVTLNQFGNLDVRRLVSGPQAVGEESQPQEAEEGEQRPAEPVPERAGAHGGEPQPEGGPGPRAQPLAHRLQDKGCLSRATGRGHVGRGRVPGSLTDAGLPACPLPRPGRMGQAQTDSWDTR